MNIPKCKCGKPAQGTLKVDSDDRVYHCSIRCECGRSAHEDTVDKCRKKFKELP